MDPEEKKQEDVQLEDEQEVQEEEQQETDTEEVEESENTEESEKSEESEEPEIDYKAEYERVSTSLGKAEEKIIKLKKKKGDVEEEVEEESGDKHGDDDLDNRVKRQVTSAILDFMEDVIDEHIDKLSNNEDEQKLIRFHLENTVPPKGNKRKDIVEAVENAYLIANKKRIKSLGKISSAKKISDQTIGAKSTNGDAPKSQQKITAEDRKMAQRFFNGDLKKWLKYKSN